MKCFRCQTENKASRKFCAQCGAPLPIKCPHCGFVNEPKDRFCGECGQSLGRFFLKPPPRLPSLEEMGSRLLITQPLQAKMEVASPPKEIEGENRLVTVMFADISGFTPASEDLSPEQVAELANECFKAIADPIIEHGGNINRFIGDCVLAFFGAPIAHEDDAERAISAALDIVQSIQRLKRQVKIGINTDMMYLGPVGIEAHQEYTVEGHAANLAKRLQEEAQPGEIIAGEGTYRLTRRAFEFEALPTLKLKGITKAVHAYSVLRKRPKPAKHRGFEGLQAELIGREEEFSKLKAALDQALKGKGQIVSIIGEAGVGKSRLVSELLIWDLGRWNERNERAPIWLEGCCLQLSMTAGYWPFIDILKEYFAWQSKDDDQARSERIILPLRELVAYGYLSEERFDEIVLLIGRLLAVKFGNDWDQRLKNANPEQIKYQTFIAIRDLFLALGKRHPVVLIFEDLHWADTLSLDLISLLMETLKDTPLFLICLYRPEREHKCGRLSTIASQKCSEHYTEIHLRKLSVHQSRRLFKSLLKTENLPHALKELILEKSQGNPFFIEEIIRSLMASGMIYQQGEVWRAKEDIKSVAVPESIQSVILSRVDRLEGTLKRVLENAAIMGRMFSRKLLAGMMQKESELERMLWKLEDLELIYQERVVPEEEYSFKHVLIQEVVYQNILQRRRLPLHQKLAEAIEVLYQDRLEEYYEQLAYHYDKGGKLEKAVAYRLKAGEKSRRAYLNEEAIGHFQKALERLDELAKGHHPTPLPQEWRLSALKGLGQIYLGVGKVAEAETHFRQAISLGQEMGLSVSELVRLYYWLGDVLWWQSRYDEQVSIGEQGLALLETEAESVEATLMNAHVAMGHKWRGNQEKWREFNRRNAQFIQRMPYSEELKPAYVNIIISYAFDDKNIDEGVKWLKVLEQKAKQHRDLRALGEVYYYRGLFILSPTGDLRRAISEYQQALELFRKIGDAKLESWSLDSLAGAFLSLGEIQKAEEHTYKEFEITKGVGNKSDIALLYIRLGTIWLCQGLLSNEAKSSSEKATDTFQKAAQLLREIGLTGARATLALGRAYLAQGQRQKSLQQFQEAMVQAKTNPVNLAAALSGLEEAYDNPEEFKAFCRRFQLQEPEVGGQGSEKDTSLIPLIPLIQWFLERTEIKDFPQNLFSDDFVWAKPDTNSYSDSDSNSKDYQPLTSDPRPPWTWHDLFGDCSFTVNNGLEIQAANGRDLWNLNLSAPRILQPVSGDFAIQTICVPVSEDKPIIGGILLWKDKENYTRLDIGIRGKYEISSMGCIGNKDVIIGRGRLQKGGGAEGQGSRGEKNKKDMERVFLRMERLGRRLDALCSPNGKDWFTVGHIEFPVDDPVEVGLHAIGMIDRTIYHGAFAEGTSIQFEAFQLWGL